MQPLLEGGSGGGGGASAKEVPPPKLLADALEALLGAVYVDSGYSLERAWDVYNRFVTIDEIDSYVSPPNIRAGFRAEQKSMRGAVTHVVY